MISAQFGILTRWQYSHNITNTSQCGPMGVFAVHIIKPDDTEEINYIHKDHTSTSLSTGLGSWNTITDESGNLIQELSFDAWGNRRDPATWRAFAGTPPEPLFDRGFTGHEHLYAFNLINMLSEAKSRSEAFAGNGRVYDPIVSRMLSPDNFIQAPGYSQSLNRYSYCWNNPLKYTDPTGQELGVENNRKFFWWANRGDSYSSHSIGPGSNNHWSDTHRDYFGNFMLMSSSTYQSSYGISNDDYNDIISNFTEFARMSQKLRTKPNGMMGFYGESTGATRLYYDYYYDEANNELVITDSYEVISPWVNVGMGNARGNWINNANYIAGSIGVFGSGASMVEGTFRLAKSGKFSPSYYPSGWSTGNQYVKTLFGISKLGNAVSNSANAVTTGIAYYRIVDGTAQPITYVDAGVGTLGIIAASASYFYGIQIPVVGPFVAIYGTTRLSWDLGSAIGPSKWYGTDDTRWFK